MIHHCIWEFANWRDGSHGVPSLGLGANLTQMVLLSGLSNLVLVVLFVIVMGSGLLALACALALLQWLSFGDYIKA